MATILPLPQLYCKCTGALADCSTHPWRHDQKRCHIINDPLCEGEFAWDKGQSCRFDVFFIMLAWINFAQTVGLVEFLVTRHNIYSENWQCRSDWVVKSKGLFGHWGPCNPRGVHAMAVLNTFRLRQNGRHIVGDIMQWIFFDEMFVFQD